MHPPCFLRMLSCVSDVPNSICTAHTARHASRINPITSHQITKVSEHLIVESFKSSMKEIWGFASDGFEHPCTLSGVITAGMICEGEQDRA